MFRIKIRNSGQKSIRQSHLQTVVFSTPFQLFLFSSSTTLPDLRNRCILFTTKSPLGSWKNGSWQCSDGHGWTGSKGSNWMRVVCMAWQWTMPAVSKGSKSFIFLFLSFNFSACFLIPSSFIFCSYIGCFLIICLI